MSPPLPLPENFNHTHSDSTFNLQLDNQVVEENFDKSKVSSKTKTPEYLLDESFVFVFFPTVHLSCQCGMSKKC